MEGGFLKHLHCAANSAHTGVWEASCVRSPLGQALAELHEQIILLALFSGESDV
jgi:hypothetical protein